jgi:hypothetical protein
MDVWSSVPPVDAHGIKDLWLTSAYRRFRILGNNIGRRIRHAACVFQKAQLGHASAWPTQALYERLSGSAVCRSCRSNRWGEDCSNESARRRRAYARVGKQISS